MYIINISMSRNFRSNLTGSLIPKSQPAKRAAKFEH